MIIDWKRSAVLHKSMAGSIVLGTAYLLKLYYSQANSEDLAWIIGPVACFVELFSDLNFIHEPGYGWVDFEHDVVIAPACAGVNFMIIAFCMSAFQLTHGVQPVVRTLTKILIAGFLSYGVTLLANVLRILLSTYFYNIEFCPPWLSPGAVHRIVGTCVFYLLLFSFSRIISTFLKRRAPERQTEKEHNPITGQLMFLVPLVWYLAFSLGVPLINQPFQAHTEMFIRHARDVVLVTVLLTPIFIAVCYLIIHSGNAWDWLRRSLYRA